MEATIQININNTFSSVNEKWIFILDEKTDADDSWLPFTLFPER